MNCAIILLLVIISGSLTGWQAHSDDGDPSLTLGQALRLAMGGNPEIGAANARADAEHSAIRSQYWLDNPRVGLMHESNLNFMEQQMGPMSLWSISQEVKFPAKYFLLGSAQKSRALSTDQEGDAKRLEVRQKVISSYYNLFTIDRIIALLQAQRETLREVARAAESRHATGAVPQQDEMKAHVEQTKIENELILAQEERDSMEGAFNAILNQEAQRPIKLPTEELSAPKVTTALEDFPKLAHTEAKRLKQAEYLSQEASSRKALSYLSYAPDFMLSYRRAFANAPDNAYAASVEITFPLWLFAKQSSEVAQASARQVEADKNLEATMRSLHADIKSLTAKVRSREKLLQIYQTSLIPQATSTLNASRSAYQAGRTTFLELLDSERSLYETRIAYYRNLGQFVDSLAKLEELASTSLSTLPFGDAQ